MSELDPEATPEPESVPLSRIEEMARGQGWHPDGGDLSAMDYLENGREIRGGMRQTIKRMEQEQKHAYDMMAEHIHKTNEKEHKEEVRTIEQQLTEAVENNDTHKALELHRQALAPPPEPAWTPPPEVDPVKAAFVQNWKDSNPWYANNLNMQNDALTFYESERRGLGEDSPEKILPVVDARMRKLHEEYFNPPTNPNAKASSGAEAGGNAKTTMTKATGGLTRADLTDSEGALFDDLINSGIPEDKLLQSVEDDRTRRS
jgi:hypothetical protein